MKLRRALAAAAATAAIAPLALFAAPTAFADESPTPTASETTPAAEESTPAAEESTPAAEESTPAAEESTPAADESTPAAEESTPAADESTPAAEESTPAPASSSPTADESDEPIEDCPVDEDGVPIVDISEVLHSSLTGLPESVVAGSGWTDFKFNVSNSSDDTIENITPFVGVGAVDWEFEDDYSDLVTLQVKQGGSWVDVATEFGEGGAFNAFALDGGRSISYDLRVKVDREVPSAVGIAIGLAEYSDDESCWISEDENYGIYFFEVLPAGSDAGDPNDAKPQTGGKDAISDVSDVDVDGELAETGAGSALPVLGLVGGFAVVAGTGVVFAMKRRKAGSHA